MNALNKIVNPFARFFGAIKENFKFKHYANYSLILPICALFAALGYAGVLKRSSANMFTQMAFAVILAVSLNFVVGFLGELSLGHAGFMCIGAYVGTYFTNLLNPLLGSKLLSLLIAMVIGGVCAALFGFIVGLPALRLKGDYLAIVTLAFGEIVRNLFMNMETFGGAVGLKNAYPYGKMLFVVAFVVMILTLVVFQNLVRSKHGRAITAIRDNEIAAKAMGINVTFYKLFAFTVAAFFAGVAGVLYGGFSPLVKFTTFSYNYSIEILVMVVLGGMGSINGSILSAVFLTYLNITLMAKLPGNLSAVRYLIYALILILVVLYNNAPKLAPVREKYNAEFVKNKLRALVRRTRTPATEDDDAAAWANIPTKITMDEIISVDLTPRTPDVGDKPTSQQKGD